MKLNPVIASVALLASPCLGFVTPSVNSHNNKQFPPSLGVSRSGISDSELPLTSDVKGEEGEQSQPPNESRVMSTAIPFMECPPRLQESDLAGNYGFDPLRLANTKEQLWRYREMEIKHARLAMMGAVGWPLAELVNRAICGYVDNPTSLQQGGHVPSVLNDGLAKISPTFWGFCLGMTAAIDMYAVAMAKKNAPGYFPGNLGFDPLKLYPDDVNGQERMKLAEINNGRVAMLAVLGYFFEEMTTKLSVVEETPFLLRFAETVEEVVDEVTIVEDAFQAAAATAL